MLYLENIEKNFSIEYEAFFDNLNTFNVVSSVQEDNVKVLLFGDSGMLMINQKGFLQEIEIIFTHPIKFGYLDYTFQRTEIGLPIFENNFVDERAAVILYIDTRQQRSLLFFKPNIKEFDLRISYKNINFLFINDELIGIETLTFVEDYDDQQQVRWLYENEKEN
jgi:hypothetical protein